MGIRVSKATGIAADRFVRTAQTYGHQLSTPPQLAQPAGAFFQVDLSEGLRLWASDLEVQTERPVQASYACPIFCSLCLEGSWSCQNPAGGSLQNFQSGDIGIYALQPDQLWTHKPRMQGRLCSLGVEISQTWLAQLDQSNPTLSDAVKSFRQASPQVRFAEASNGLRAQAVKVFDHDPQCATYTLRLHALALELLAQAFDLITPCGLGVKARVSVSPLSHADRLSMAKVRRTLDEQFARPWTLQTLASSARISPKRLQRCFNLAFGVSVFGYLQRLRLERARNLLEGGAAVTQVTFDVGYAHLGSFSRAYRQHFGYSPSQAN